MGSLRPVLLADLSSSITGLGQSPPALLGSALITLWGGGTIIPPLGLIIVKLAETEIARPIGAGADAIAAAEAPIVINDNNAVLDFLRRHPRPS